jgi:ligand-binding sensor protein
MNGHVSLDVLLSREVCRLLDSFAAIIKTQVIFYSAGGEILKRGRDCSVSPFCSLVQEKYFSLETCQKLDRKMQEFTRRTGKLCSYRCHAGLTEIIAPIRVLDEVAGFVGLGQFRISDDIPGFIRDDPEMIRRYLELPRFTPQETECMKDMLHALIEYIVDKELISFPGNLRYRRLVCYINDNLAGKLTLSQTANTLSISPSGLEHFLHDKYDTSFKRLVIRLRLKRAEELWRASPDAPVREIANAVGIEDAHYFSRLYHKERGMSPREFKDRL